MQSKIEKVEIRHRKLLKPAIVEILSELSDIELWVYNYASPEIVNRKFSSVRKKVTNLSD